MGGSPVSPGAALLRSSRMFSLPKPLPKPKGRERFMALRNSPSMTQPTPQMQSIASPLPSRQNGDWGFKRPFPLKTTLKTSTPFIRVENIDARENVTDFTSASDHTLSLEKFQELHIAISLPTPKPTLTTDHTNAMKLRLINKSVFEKSLDTTDVHDGKDFRHRWKFDGPALEKLSHREFMDYLKTKVRPRRSNFRALLRQQFAADISIKRNTTAMDRGMPRLPDLTAADITDAQFTDYMRIIRSDRTFLYSLVSRFLDLPPIRRERSIAEHISSRDKNIESPWLYAGLPPTHPSAGLSYLRTSSFLENHPVYGPQARRSPTLARIIYPRNVKYSAKIGVAGFVCEAPAGENSFNVRDIRNQRFTGKEPVQGTAMLDLKTWGGGKAFVEPVTAVVDRNGRIIVEIKESSIQADLIYMERTGQKSVYHDGFMRRQSEE